MSLQLPSALNTERLVLRLCREEDFTAFLSFMLDDEATQHLLFTPEQRSEAGARELFDAVVQSYDTRTPIFVLVICPRETGEYVGSCGLSPLESGEAECFYTVLRSHWHRGYATEATRRLLSYAIEELNLSRIVAHVGSANPASARVAEKAGMQFAQKTLAAEARPAGSLYEMTPQNFVPPRTHE